MSQLTDEDRTTLARAHRHESIWRYGRYLLLITGAGLFLYGMIASYPTNLDAPACRCMNPALLMPAGAALFGSVVGSWNNRQRQLLLRLTRGAGETLPP
jgi:hypothetical protein